jgi:ABC-type lipopolysaccharide export system ATPase subunit
MFLSELRAQVLGVLHNVRRAIHLLPRCQSINGGTILRLGKPYVQCKELES